MTAWFSLIGAVGQEPPALLSFMPFVLMFLVFYFVLIRPQQNQQKQHEALIGNLAKNDEVVTVGGIHGTVVGLKDKSVLLRIAENVKIEVDRSAIVKIEKSRAIEPELIEEKTK